MPGHDKRCPRLTVFWNVDIAGLNAHAWRYCPSSNLVLSFRMIAFTEWYCDFGCLLDDCFCSRVVGKLMSHKPSRRLRWPVRMTLVSLIIFIVCLSNTVIQSSSQSWPIDNRDEFVNPGKTCAYEALGERLVCSGTRPRDVACISTSLGNFTFGPMCNSCWFWRIWASFLVK